MTGRLGEIRTNTVRYRVLAPGKRFVAQCVLLVRAMACFLLKVRLSWLRPGGWWVV